MSSSREDTWENEKFIKRTQVFTNEYVNLSFLKIQDRYQGDPPEFSISGMLFRTFSEIDLFEISEIFGSIKEKTKIRDIDPETFLCTYEGHTIFSIFFD